MKKLGKYEILREIGAGGMGRVYEARDSLIGRTVAIKVMSEELDEDLRKRFYQEARAVGSLRHPNIVTIYDLAEQDGAPYIVMEYLDGTDLAEKLSQGDELSLIERLRIIIEVTKGLDYAHAKGIVHRDIKPGNIRVLSDGSVKIIDFGIARFGMSKITKTGFPIGTWHYMSPEQISGEKVDRQTDIWAVGVVLYEIVAGRVPFEAEHPLGLINRVTQTEPVPFATLGIDVPDALSRCVMRALSKNPAARHETGAALAAKLESVLAELAPGEIELESEIQRDSQKYLKLSRNLVKRKKFDRATDAARRSLTLDPANAEAQALLREIDTKRDQLNLEGTALQLLEEGRRSLRDGRIEEVAASIERAASVGSDSTKVQRLKGELELELEHARNTHGLKDRLESARGFFALRDFPGAREELEEILSVDPTSSEAKQLLQSVHDATRTELHEQSDAALERGDYDRARRILVGHLRENPDDREIQSRLKRVFELQDEVSRLDATIIKKRADKLATTYAQAVAAKKRGELDRALELASSVLPQAGPDSEVARLVSTLERALAERRQQDAGLREAREPSRAGLHKEAGGRATRVYPGKREDGRRQQLDQLLKDATKLQRAGDEEGALARAAQIQELEPENEAAAQLVRSIHHARERRHLQKKQEVEKLLEHAADAESSGDFETAIQLSRKGLELDSNDARASEIAARCEGKLTERRETERKVQQHINAAKTAVKARRYDTGLNAVAAVLDLDPDNRVARALEGKIALEKEQQEQARAKAVAATLAKADNAFGRGDYAGAAQEARRALELDTKNDTALELLRKAESAARAKTKSSPRDATVGTRAPLPKPTKAFEINRTTRICLAVAAIVAVAVAAAIWLRPGAVVPGGDVVLGAVWVNVAPWAEIQRVRDAETGETMAVPVAPTPYRLALPPGSYVVEVLNHHYSEIPHVFEVEVRAGIVTEKHEILPGLSYEDLVLEF